jgi:hypothetical protein
MEEDLNTLCYCSSCVEERKDIEMQLRQMPPSVTQTSIANYLNLRYEQMREKCLKNPFRSPKFSENIDKYGCENVYTIVGFLTLLGAVFGVGAIMTVVVWLASVLPIS